jgi:hypothetical protein
MGDISFLTSLPHLDRHELTFFRFHKYHSPTLRAPSTTTATTGPAITPGFTPPFPDDPELEFPAGMHWI